jgi:phosphopantothenoylcysteine decarboxylase
MANVLLGVTGSVAAIRTPVLNAELMKAGHAVKIVATKAALYFFDAAPLRESLFLDEDEWPGRDRGRLYERDDPVLHIELRRWADLLVIAPLDANTLAKLAVGLADNCLTCVWRAWDTRRPVILAPAMNTLMWEHPLTVRHLRQLADDAGAGPVEAADPAKVIEQINRGRAALRIVAPQSKRLACGDVGIGAVAEVADIVELVAEMSRNAQ